MPAEVLRHYGDALLRRPGVTSRLLRPRSQSDPAHMVLAASPTELFVVGIRAYADERTIITVMHHGGYR